MVNESVVDSEISHLTGLIFGSRTLYENRTELLARLLSEYNISVSVRMDGDWFGYKNYSVQVLRRNPDGTFDEPYCTGVYGDNGEFHTKTDAIKYGILVGLSFALSINMKRGFLCI